MPTQRLLLQKWLPDLTPKSDQLVKAKNVIRKIGKYEPAFGANQRYNPCAGNPLLMCSVIQPEGDITTFVGTSNSLYRVDASSQDLCNISQNLDNVTANLDAYWSCDDGTGTTLTDNSGNGHNGTLHGNAAWSVGKLKYGLSLDGSAGTYVSGSLNCPSGDHSVAFWVRYTDFVQWSAVLSFLDHINSEGYVLALYNSTTLRFCFGKGVANDYDVQNITLSEELEKNRWYHFVVTRSGNTWTLYINGEQIAQFTYNLSHTSNSNYVIGRWSTSFNNYYLAGVVDDIRVYSSVLSSSDISKLYQLPGEYSVTTWDYAAYGDVIVFSSKNETPQIVNSVTSGFAADLSPDAPKGLACALFKDHLFLGNVYEGSSEYPRRLWRSAKGDLTDWSESYATGCGYYDIPAWGDEIVALYPLGDALIVYLNNSIYMVTELGPPLWFSHICIENTIGTLGPHSVIPLDRNTHIFLSRDGVYRLRGTEIEKLDYGIGKYLANLIDFTKSKNVTSFYDTSEDIIYWLIYTSDNENNPSYILSYYLYEGYFTLIDSPFWLLGKRPAISQTIDGLPNIPLDSYNDTPFDSPVYNAGGTVYSGIDLEKRLADWGACSATIEIETGEVDFEKIVTIRRVYVLGNGIQTSSKLKIYYKLRDNENYKFKEVNINSKGIANFFATGRFFKFELIFEEPFDDLYGFNIDYVIRSEVL